MINVKTAPWDAEEGELIQPAGRNLAPKLSGCGQREGPRAARKH